MKPAAIAKRSRDALLEQWQQLLRVRHEVLKSPDIEAVHDLRVASRRFRGALDLFDPWLPPKKAGLLKKNIRKLTRVLGGLRNIDEALLFFRLHTPADSAGQFQLCYLLTQMRCGEQARIAKALKNFDHHRLDRTVRKAAIRLEENQIAESRKAPLTTSFTDSYSRLYQQIQDLLPVATARKERESRHALRIAIKKWRYFFEILQPVLKRDYSSILGVIKEYQTILGRMNDVAEFGALCSGLTLSRREHTFVETTLKAENELLLQELTGLIDQKPLAYTAPF